MKKRSVDIIQFKLNGIVVNLFNFDSLPIGLERAFVFRVLNCFNSKNDIVGVKRLAIMPENVFFQRDVVGQAFIFNRISFDQVGDKIAVTVIFKQPGINDLSDVPVGVIGLG